LFVPKESSLQPDNFRLLVDLFLEGGLENVKNSIRTLENSDPDCKKYVRFKKSDDITAIALSF